MSGSGQPLDLMIEALGLEVAAIKKKGGSTSVDLAGGVFAAMSNDSFLYRFPCFEEVRLRDDTPIRVQFGQHDVDGSVVSAGEGVVVLALEEDLGPRLPHVRVIADDSFLIERLLDRLRQVRSGEAPFNMVAALRVIGASPIRATKADVPRPVLDGPTPLKQEQVDAVGLSLLSDTAFVWGPPGTGKTTVVARIVKAHFLAGRSVLLVSNTNIAVDTALEKVAEQLQNEPAFHAGAVLRHGPVLKPELKEKFGDQVNLDKVVERLSQSLQRDLLATRSEVARQSQAAQQLRDAIRRHNLKAAAAAELLREQDALIRQRERARDLYNRAKVHAEALDRLRQDLKRADTMGTVRRLFSGLSPERLRRQIVETEALSRATGEAQQAAELTCQASRAKVQSAEGQCLVLAEQVAGLPPLDQCRSRLLSVDIQIKELEGRAAELHKQIEQVRQDVLNRCQVLATTVYRTYLKGQVERQFDVVIIDEASMLMLPMSFYAAGRAKQTAVIAGDFRQLPPIVLSDELLAADWLKKDAFCKIGVPQQVATAPHYLAALRIQFRMRCDICEVTNRLFYDDHPLVTDSIVDKPESRQMPIGHGQLLYVDTASLHPWAATKMGTYSRYNLLHALLIKKMVLYLRGTGYLDDGEAVGIVAPYSAQTRLIQALLKDADVEDVVAATVHRFQGNEKRTMLVDLTDSTGCMLGRFMKGVSPEDDGSRLLNVAISRAKHHVILIANFGYLESRAPNGSVVVRLLRLFKDFGSRVEMGTILPFGDEDWIGGLHKVTPPSIELADDGLGAFNEATFYPAFAHDLETAEKSIVVLSPFLTNRGVARWVDHLRAALQRGVQVRIVTKPGAEFGGAPEDEVNETIGNLRNLSIAVDLRGRMHEKVAIIDQRVAWHGSLNILSHRDTSESMLRLVGETACRQLTDLISLPHQRRDQQWTPSDPENPPCATCQAPTVLRDGRFGLYFECSICGAKIDSHRRAAQQSASRPPQADQMPAQPKAAGAVRRCSAPGCDGRLVPKKGRYGAFLGCSNYPRCRATEKSDR